MIAEITTGGLLVVCCLGIFNSSRN